MALGTCFAGSSTRNVVSFLRKYFWDESQLEDFSFSDLHKAYFNLFETTFDNVLFAATRAAIDQVDATGRTVLSWATWRGDRQTVTRMLYLGANPDIADVEGQTSLHWACYAGDRFCTRQLLQAKASTVAKDHWGRTPSMVAAINLKLTCLRLLLAHGSDVDASDS